ncbi:Uncharacterised protein r2_g3286 [Pycnogonum litorale]
MPSIKVLLLLQIVLQVAKQFGETQSNHVIESSGQLCWMKELAFNGKCMETVGNVSYEDPNKSFKTFCEAEGLSRAVLENEIDERAASRLLKDGDVSRVLWKPNVFIYPLTMDEISTINNVKEFISTASYRQLNSANCSYLSMDTRFDETAKIGFTDCNRTDITHFCEHQKEGFRKFQIDQHQFKYGTFFEALVDCLVDQNSTLYNVTVKEDIDIIVPVLRIIMEIFARRPTMIWTNFKSLKFINLDDDVNRALFEQWLNFFVCSVVYKTDVVTFHHSFASCKNVYNLICEYEAYYPVCEDGHYLHDGDICTYIVHDKEMNINYQEAVQFCQNLGYKMADVDIVKKSVQHLEGDDVVVWSANEESNNKCFAFNKLDSTYASLKCSRSLNTYVCAYQASMLKCPDGFHQYRSDCFHFSSEKVDYFEALANCSSLNSSIAFIVETDYAIQIFDSLDLLSIKDAWIMNSSYSRLKYWIPSSTVIPNEVNEVVESLETSNRTTVRYTTTVDEITEEDTSTFKHSEPLKCTLLMTETVASVQLTDCKSVHNYVCQIKLTGK